MTGQVVRRISVWASLLVLITAPLLCADTDLNALQRVMGEVIGVPLAHNVALTEAKENAPAIQVDAWNFKPGIRNLTISYNRYLNQPPQFAGSHTSLDGNMGVGFDSGAMNGDDLLFENWNCWQSGPIFKTWNTLRVTINGTDVMAQKPAKLTEAKGGFDRGTLRLAWDLDEGGELALNFTITEEGQGIYARVDLVPGKTPIGKIQVALYGFAGGFGPIWGGPSHRWVATAKGDWELPPEDQKNQPEVLLEKGDDWIFYANKLQSHGSLGLLLNKEEFPAGKVRMSHRGETTTLDYPPETRQIHLAFYAPGRENIISKEGFVSSLERERAFLKEAPVTGDR